MSDLNQAYEYCRQIIEQHSKTFSRAFSILPKQKRQAVWAIYAFCRHVDDLVDEGDHPEAELEQFSLEFDRFMEGKMKLEHPRWIALEDVFKHFRMDAEPFYDMITGQKMDLYPEQFDTMADLLEYCYHVASTVGLMLLPVLAPKKAHLLKPSAIELGYGMQITNILRDIGEDLERGRVYLPQELMYKHGYTMEDLHAHRVNDRFISLWEELALEAEFYYDKAMENLHYYPMSSRTPVGGAARMYRAILTTVRKNDYQVFNTRQFVSDEEKKRIIAELQS